MRISSEYRTIVFRYTRHEHVIYENKFFKPLSLKIIEAFNFHYKNLHKIVLKSPLF